MISHIIHGLGCESVELNTRCLSAMRRHGLLRPAEDEEVRRFTEAEETAVPDNDFEKRLRTPC